MSVRAQNIIHPHELTRRNASLLLRIRSLIRRNVSLEAPRRTTKQLRNTPARTVRRIRGNPSTHVPSVGHSPGTRQPAAQKPEQTRQNTD